MLSTHFCNNYYMLSMVGCQRHFCVSILRNIISYCVLYNNIESYDIILRLIISYCAIQPDNAPCKTISSFIISYCAI